jgi:GT2 family glycosyltransferase
MQLSIIIVNYRTPQLVVDCLRSVYAHTKNISFEVIVVDNQSGDNSDPVIRSAFPGLRWIQMNENTGFARANNAGIHVATGDAVLLLNSDTLVNDNAIGNCFQQFMASGYAACGAQLINPDGSPQISGNYFMKGGVNHLLPLPWLGSFLKAVANLLRVKKPNVPEAKDEVEVDWINGAFLMVRRTAFEKAGLMDEDFFLYAEETEWCSRLKKTGRLCIFGNCRVVHLQGASANETFQSSGQGYMNMFDRKGLQIMVSNLLRVRKQFGAGWFLLHLFFLLVEIPVFFFGLIFSNIFTLGRSRYRWSQFAGYCKNVFRILGLSPTTLRNKPHFYKLL